MGLQAAFQRAAQTAIKAFGDVPVSTNYHAYVTATVAVTTGAQTVTYSTVAGVKVVFTDFKIGQVDGEMVKPEDKIALIAGLDLPGVTPGVNDQITHDASTTWQVQRVMLDAAGALYKLQVRRP